MTNIAVLRSTFNRTNWKAEFAQAVIDLMPDVNPDAADELSDTEYKLSSSRRPVDVARDWVASHRSSDKGGSSEKSA